MDLKKQYRNAVDIKIWKPSKVKKHFPDLWDTIRNLLPGLNSKHVAMMASVALSMCHKCGACPVGDGICRKCSK